MRGLAGKTVVVCGGATGIGAGTAERLAAEGMRVVVGDINEPGAKATAERIAEAGGVALSAGFDLAEEESVQALVDLAVTQWGAVHGLVNVGADTSPNTIGRDLDLLEMDFDVWRRTLDVNLLGFVRSSRAVIPLFLAQGGGAIVNVSSGAAFGGEPTRPAYAASKAAINTLTRHVASRWGKAGVRCNAVSPGAVLSEAMINSMSAEFLDGMLARTRSPRLGQPADLAAAVAFLLSDDTAWVNGQVWTIDGGAALRQ
ncbi:SDR family NAD(P)-dependent oxidoreductase [Kutzneria sp. NPDC052558]|uniref:SDR family NAD(P)-dependent oxidoreductase n=1 Tax=Kutzneria sp. NPDC052558 TaxID=3364121 RepID=UPI0037CA4004